MRHPEKTNQYQRNDQDYLPLVPIDSDSHKPTMFGLVQTDSELSRVLIKEGDEITVTYLKPTLFSEKTGGGDEVSYIFTHITGKVAIRHFKNTPYTPETYLPVLIDGKVDIKNPQTDQIATFQFGLPSGSTNRHDTSIPLRIYTGDTVQINGNQVIPVVIPDSNILT